MAFLGGTTIGVADDQFTNPNKKSGGAFPTAEEVGGEVFIETKGEGDQVPMDLPLETLDGEETTLRQVLSSGDKPVVLNFFMAHNEKALEELKALDRLEQENPGLRVVAIHLGSVGGKLTPDTPMASVNRTIRALRQDLGVNRVDTYLDKKSYAVQALGLRNAPATFLVKQDGTIVKNYLSTQNWADDARQKEISQFIASS
ncbi:hypothetical protein AN478_05965 [Thiohalorhabdus denitrificans]|nr:hypothetical protein AN478_05965 [Thiohalorhabdus denitrificans]